MIRSPTAIFPSSPGVVVDDHSIRFVASQPWLFPRSLLLGFTAEAADDTIDVDQDELEDAADGTDVVLVDTSKFGSVVLKDAHFCLQCESKYDLPN